MTQRGDEKLAESAIEKGAYEEAVHLLRPLAERNSQYAMLALGWIYEKGVTGAPDVNAARTYYEGAVAQGSATAYSYLGRLLFRDGQEAEARAAFERGAQLENDECKFALQRLADNNDEKLAGDALRNRQYDEAIRLLRPLAEHNSKYALLSLGWIYETGATGAPDLEVARSYYERAASQGCAAAHFDLGRLLLKEGEEGRARAAFQAGAQLDDVPCMAELGRMMVEGRGGPRDEGVGTTWLQKATAEGHIYAQGTLLALEEPKARSIFEKLSIRRRLAALARKAAREMVKDPYSDKLR